MSFRKRNSHTKSKRADSTKIHVVVRVRPRIAEDLDSTIHKRPGASAYEECVEEDEARSSVFLKKPYFDTREFAFDCVLGRGATQAQAYEAVARGVVDDVMAGFNGTILAYGQTGTGKTHTIYGPLSYWRRPGRTSAPLPRRREASRTTSRRGAAAPSFRALPPRPWPPRSAAAPGRRARGAGRTPSHAWSRNTTYAPWSGARPPRW